MLLSELSYDLGETMQRIPNIETQSVRPLPLHSILCVNNVVSRHRGSRLPLFTASREQAMPSMSPLFMNPSLAISFGHKVKSMEATCMEHSYWIIVTRRATL